MITSILFKKRLKYFFILFSLSVVNNSFAQAVSIVEVLQIQNDTAALNKRVKFLINKYHKEWNKSKISIFHIYSCGFTKPITKNDFSNYKFLSKLTPKGNYKIGRKRKAIEYIRTETYIADSSGRMIGIGDARYIYDAFNSYALNLWRTIQNRKIESAFYINTKDDLMLIDKEGAVSVIKFGLEMKEYTLSQFVEYCFDERIYPE